MLERQLSANRLAIPIAKLGDTTAKLAESSAFQKLPSSIREMAVTWIAFVEVAGVCVANLAFELIDGSLEGEATHRIPTAETVDSL